jgi:hypothetical protein
LEFEVGDHVYLRVSPMKGVKRFGVKGKLAPSYIGPFPNLKKCGTMAYKHDLPPSLAGVHDIFHVSQLKKCSKAPVDVVLPEVTLLEADLGKQGFPSFLPSRLHFAIVWKCAIVHCSCRAATPSKSQVEISVRGRAVTHRVLL